MGGDWRDHFEYAWQSPDPEPDEGPGLTWRADSAPTTGPARGAASPAAPSPPRRRRRWLAYVRLEDPPGLSPITTVGRFDTVEAAQVATDEVWASR